MDIPTGMTKAQYYILFFCKRGEPDHLPKLAKLLKMDQSQMESELNILKQNGLLSDDNKVTPKGLLAYEGKVSVGLMSAPTTLGSSEKLMPHVLGCPSCNAPLDLTTATGDYLKCAYCGVTVKLH